APGLPPAPTVAPLSGGIADTLAPVSEVDAATAAPLADAAVHAPGDEVASLDADAVSWDIDVQTYASHPRVRYYLKHFRAMSPARLAVVLERGARYEPMIRQRLAAEGLPGDLFYLAMIESGWSSEAVSRAYAVGMWQFMRGTGRGYGLRVDTWVDERRDPVKATDAAARHLRDLRERFGSLYLAAAAYNAGAGTVSRGLGKLEPSEELEAAEEAGDAAFFRLAETRLLRHETRDYVPKLIAAALIAKQPARYGITTSPVQPFAYDSLLVPDATGLDVVARLAGVGLAEVRDLNPQYLRLATPPDTESVIRLPTGTGAATAAAFEQLPADERVQYLTHVLRRGERLATVAANHRIPLADLRAANPKVGSRPRAGTRLVVPAVAIPSAIAVRAAGDRRSHHASSRTHKVRRGETLTGIARRYRVSLAALKSANAIRNEHALMAGARLRIPG
ncbi:MAG TPA: transglycosylase SLT domain-containing protein, partial [Gemmatimonadales bacterium]|nr:transglycosylase SLT domain-containing protein [Gemmatimonadales bacterium]